MLSIHAPDDFIHAMARQVTRSGIKSVPNQEARLPFLDSHKQGRRETYAGKDVPLRAIRHLGKVLYIKALAELPMHRHPGALEICFIVRGNLTWRIEAQMYAIKPGDIFLTLPGELHGGLWSVMQPCELYFIQICQNSCDPSTRPFLKSLMKSPMRCFPGNPRIPVAFESLIDECRHKRLDSEMIMKVELNALLARVLRDSSAATQQKSQTLSPAVRRVLDHVTENPEKWPSAEELTSIAGVGRSLLFEKFRCETGETLQHYIQQARINRAKTLLKAGGHSVTDVAMNLGFSSSQYFATVFRRHCGITPREYIDLAIGT